MLARAAPRDRRWEGAGEVYSEGRHTRRPTARHIRDLLEHVRRYQLLHPGQAEDDEPLRLRDKLTPTQQRLRTLLGINPDHSGQ